MLKKLISTLALFALLLQFPATIVAQAATPEAGLTAETATLAEEAAAPEAETAADSNVPLGYTVTVPQSGTVRYTLTDFSTGYRYYVTTSNYPTGGNIHGTSNPGLTLAQYLEQYSPIHYSNFPSGLDSNTGWYWATSRQEISTSTGYLDLTSSVGKYAIVFVADSNGRVVHALETPQYSSYDTSTYIQVGGEPPMEGAKSGADLELQKLDNSLLNLIVGNPGLWTEDDIAAAVLDNVKALIDTTRYTASFVSRNKSGDTFSCRVRITSKTDSSDTAADTSNRLLKIVWSDNDLFEVTAGNASLTLTVMSTPTDVTAVYYTTTASPSRAPGNGARISSVPGAVRLPDNEIGTAKAITNLTNNTTYHVQVYFTDANGTVVGFGRKSATPRAVPTGTATDLLTNTLRGFNAAELPWNTERTLAAVSAAIAQAAGAEAFPGVDPAQYTQTITAAGTYLYDQETTPESYTWAGRLTATSVANPADVATDAAERKIAVTFAEADVPYIFSIPALDAVAITGTTAKITPLVPKAGSTNSTITATVGDSTLQVDLTPDYNGGTGAEVKYYTAKGGTLLPDGLLALSGTSASAYIELSRGGAVVGYTVTVTKAGAASNEITALPGLAKLTEVAIGATANAQGRYPITATLAYDTTVVDLTPTLKDNLSELVGIYTDDACTTPLAYPTNRVELAANAPDIFYYKVQAKAGSSGTDRVYELTLTRKAIEGRIAYITDIYNNLANTVITHPEGTVDGTVTANISPYDEYFHLDAIQFWGDAQPRVTAWNYKTQADADAAGATWSPYHGSVPMYGGANTFWLEVSYGAATAETFWYKFTLTKGNTIDITVSDGVVNSYVDGMYGYGVYTRSVSSGSLSFDLYGFEANLPVKLEWFADSGCTTAVGGPPTHVTFTPPDEAEMVTPQTTSNHPLTFQVAATDALEKTGISYMRLSVGTGANAFTYVVPFLVMDKPVSGLYFVDGDNLQDQYFLKVGQTIDMPYKFREVGTNGSITLKNIKLDPDKLYTSDSSVLSLSMDPSTTAPNIKVTGKAAGTALVTITSQDGKWLGKARVNVTGDPLTAVNAAFAPGEILVGEKATLNITGQSASALAVLAPDGVNERVVSEVYYDATTPWDKDLHGPKPALAADWSVDKDNNLTFTGRYQGYIGVKVKAQGLDADGNLVTLESNTTVLKVTQPATSLGFRVDGSTFTPANGATYTYYYNSAATANELVLEAVAGPYYLYADDTLAIKETLVQPAFSEPVTWKGANKNVAVAKATDTDVNFGRAKLTIGSGAVGKTTKITISCGKMKATLSLKVVTGVAPGAATILKAEKNLPWNSTLMVGSSFTLKADKKSSSNAYYEWVSSNARVATVSASGKVTGVSTGTTDISLVSGGQIIDSVELQVVPVVKSLALSQKTLTLAKGDTYRIYDWGSGNDDPPALADMLYATPYDSSYHWAGRIQELKTSKKAVVSIDMENGVIRAEKKGSSVISVTDPLSKKTAKLTVKVVDSADKLPTATKFEWKNNKDKSDKVYTVPSLALGKSLKVPYTLKDSKADVRWSSSNPHLVQVDGTGKITATGLHTYDSDDPVVITGWAGDKALYLHVYEVYQPVSSLVIKTRETKVNSSNKIKTIKSITIDNYTNDYINIFAFSTLVAGKQDLAINNNSMVWTTSNPDVVDLVRTSDFRNVALVWKGPGKATVTVSFGGKTAKLAVTSKLVADNDIYALGWSDGNADVFLNTGKGATKTADLKVLVEPKGLSNKIKWTVGNKKIATVSSSGKVTAKKAGTTWVSATVDGQQIWKTIHVGATPAETFALDQSGPLYFSPSAATQYISLAWNLPADYSANAALTHSIEMTASRADGKAPQPASDFAASGEDCVLQLEQYGTTGYHYLYTVKLNTTNLGNQLKAGYVPGPGTLTLRDNASGKTTSIPFQIMTNDELAAGANTAVASFTKGAASAGAGGMLQVWKGLNLDYVALDEHGDEILNPSVSWYAELTNKRDSSDVYGINLDDESEPLLMMNGTLLPVDAITDYSIRVYATADNTAGNVEPLVWDFDGVEVVGQYLSIETNETYDFLSYHHSYLNLSGDTLYLDANAQNNESLSESKTVYLRVRPGDGGVYEKAAINGTATGNALSLTKVDFADNIFKLTHNGTTGKKGQGTLTFTGGAANLSRTIKVQTVVYPNQDYYDFRIMQGKKDVTDIYTAVSPGKSITLKPVFDANVSSKAVTYRLENVQAAKNTSSNFDDVSPLHWGNYIKVSSSGKVTGVKPCYATLHITHNQSGITRKVYLYVYKMVTGVSIDQKDFTIYTNSASNTTGADSAAYPDRSAVVRATITGPDYTYTGDSRGTVIWSTSNPEVVYFSGYPTSSSYMGNVSSGLWGGQLKAQTAIKAKGEGSATITATDYFSGKSAKVVVTVTNDRVDIQSITVPPLYEVKPGASVTLKGTVLPADTDKNLNWQLDGPYSDNQYLKLDAKTGKLKVDKDYFHRYYYSNRPNYDAVEVYAYANSYNYNGRASASTFLLIGTPPGKMYFGNSTYSMRKGDTETLTDLAGTPETGNSTSLEYLLTKAQILFDATGDTPLTVTSSNPSIIAVTKTGTGSGSDWTDLLPYTLTAAGSGKATITVKLDKLSASFTVDTAETRPQDIETVKDEAKNLDYGYLTLPVGREIEADVETWFTTTTEGAKIKGKDIQLSASGNMDAYSHSDGTHSLIGFSEGTYTLTAQLQDANNTTIDTATISVRMVNADVSGFYTFDNNIMWGARDTVDVAHNATWPLNVQTSAGATVTHTSSAASVASVNDAGLVTGAAQGEAAITSTIKYAPRVATAVNDVLPEALSTFTTSVTVKAPFTGYAVSLDGATPVTDFSSPLALNSTWGNITVSAKDGSALPYGFYLVSNSAPDVAGIYNTSGYDSVTDGSYILPDYFSYSVYRNGTTAVQVGTNYGAAEKATFTLDITTPPVTSLEVVSYDDNGDYEVEYLVAGSYDNDNLAILSAYTPDTVLDDSLLEWSVPKNSSLEFDGGATLATGNYVDVYPTGKPGIGTVTATYSVPGGTPITKTITIKVVGFATEKDRRLVLDGKAGDTLSLSGLLSELGFMLEPSGTGGVTLRDFDSYSHGYSNTLVSSYKTSALANPIQSIAGDTITLNGARGTAAISLGMSNQVRLAGYSPTAYDSDSVEVPSVTIYLQNITGPELFLDGTQENRIYEVEKSTASFDLSSLLSVQPANAANLELTWSLNQTVNSGTLSLQKNSSGANTGVVLLNNPESGDKATVTVRDKYLSRNNMLGQASYVKPVSATILVVEDPNLNEIAAALQASLVGAITVDEYTNLTAMNAKMLDIARSAIPSAHRNKVDYGLAPGATYELEGNHFVWKGTVVYTFGEETLEVPATRSTQRRINTLAYTGIEAPAVGAVAQTAYQLPADANYTIDNEAYPPATNTDIIWYKDGTQLPGTSEIVFEKGEQYRADIVFTPKSGYCFYYGTGIDSWVRGGVEFSYGFEGDGQLRATNSYSALPNLDTIAETLKVYYTGTTMVNEDADLADVSTLVEEHAQKAIPYAHRDKVSYKLAVGATYELDGNFFVWKGTMVYTLGSETLEVPLTVNTQKKIAALVYTGIQTPVADAAAQTAYQLPEGANYTINNEVSPPATNTDIIWFKDYVPQTGTDEIIIEKGSYYYTNIYFTANPGYCFAHGIDTSSWERDGVDFSWQLDGLGQLVAFNFFPIIPDLSAIADTLRAELAAGLVINEDEGLAEVSALVEEYAEDAIPYSQSSEVSYELASGATYGLDGDYFVWTGTVVYTHGTETENVNLTVNTQKKIAALVYTGIQTPVAGAVAQTAYQLPEGANYTINNEAYPPANTDIIWHKNLTQLPGTNEIVFEKGAQYRADIIFTPKPGYCFDGATSTASWVRDGVNFSRSFDDLVQLRLYNSFPVIPNLGAIADTLRAKLTAGLVINEDEGLAEVSALVEEYAEDAIPYAQRDQVSYELASGATYGLDGDFFVWTGTVVYTHGTETENVNLTVNTQKRIATLPYTGVETPAAGGEAQTTYQLPAGAKYTIEGEAYPPATNTDIIWYKNFIRQPGTSKIVFEPGSGYNCEIVFLPNPGYCLDYDTNVDEWVEAGGFYSGFTENGQFSMKSDFPAIPLYDMGVHPDLDYASTSSGQYVIFSLSGDYDARTAVIPSEVAALFSTPNAEGKTGLDANGMAHTKSGFDGNYTAVSIPLAEIVADAMEAGILPQDSTEMELVEFNETLQVLGHGYGSTASMTTTCSATDIPTDYGMLVARGVSPATLYIYADDGPSPLIINVYNNINFEVEADRYDFYAWPTATEYTRDSETYLNGSTVTYTNTWRGSINYADQRISDPEVIKTFYTEPMANGGTVWLEKVEDGADTYYRPLATINNGAYSAVSLGATDLLEGFFGTDDDTLLYFEESSNDAMGRLSGYKYFMGGYTMGYFRAGGRHSVLIAGFGDFTIEVYPGQRNEVTGEIEKLTGSSALLLIDSFSYLTFNGIT